MEFLFGEGQFGLRILLAVFLVLALIGVLAWLVHVFRSKRTRAASRRTRQPRLAVIDAAVVDGRRRLVIIRRDNVEHLLMIGGRADIVVEPNIVRGTTREPALARPTAFAEQLEAALDALAPSHPQQGSVPQHTESELAVPRSVDRLASDQRAREPQLPGAAAEAVFTPAAEHSSAEATQRLVEAMLPRHASRGPA
jgi:flagellar biogenesis protein FliO